MFENLIIGQSLIFTDQSCLKQTGVGSKKTSKQYKKFNSKREWRLIYETLVDCFRNKIPDSRAAGVLAIPNSQLA